MSEEKTVKEETSVEEEKLDKEEASVSEKASEEESSVKEESAAKAESPEGEGGSEKEESAETEEKSAGAAPEKPANGRRANNALGRCVAALALAAAVLWATGFSAFTMLRGPVEAPDIQMEEQGTFVFRDVNAVLGFYSGDYSKGEKTVENYAVVPMGGKMVSVRFTGRYMESAQAVCENTYGYINGAVTGLNKYVTVQGTVDMLTEAESKNMYDWFELNQEQMVEIGLIRDTATAADYLSDYVLLVDTVNGLGQNTVLWLTGLAALLLVYMVVEMVLMACGFYLPEEAKAAARAKKELSGDKSGEDGAEDKESAEGAEKSGDADGESGTEDSGDKETESESEDSDAEDGEHEPDAEQPGDPETGTEDENGDDPEGKNEA